MVRFTSFIDSSFILLQKDTVRNILLIILAFLGLSILFFMAFKQWSFELMTNSILKHSVEHKIVEPENLGDYLVLDIRNKDEYAVSKIPSAVHINPDTEDFSDQILSSEKPILGYCSVGLRSEGVLKKIKDANPSLNVYNLKGGIFQWINDEKKLVDTTNSVTQKIHTYNTAWGLWVRKGEKVN